jgi:hypothetical protein
MEVAFVVEDCSIDNSSIIFLIHPILDHCGQEHINLLAIDVISVSDVQCENHRIALERVEAIKHAKIVNTSQVGYGKSWSNT